MYKALYTFGWAYHSHAHGHAHTHARNTHAVTTDEPQAQPFSESLINTWYIKGTVSSAEEA